MVSSRRRRLAAAGAAALVVAVAIAVATRSGSGPSGPRMRASPRCLPAALNGSAVLPHSMLEVSPLPGSRDASPRTQVSLLGLPARALAGVTVTGSRTGPHAGALRPYSQGDGASFVPSSPFAPLESVTVAGTVNRGGAAAPFSYRFSVAEPDPPARVAPAAVVRGQPGDVQHFYSRPDLHPPAIAVAVDSARAEPGYVLAAPYAGPAQSGPLIFDDRGRVVWFHPLPAGVEATSLRVQRFRGQPVLTWWQGYIPPQGFGQGEEVIADGSYRVIAVVRAGNGFAADLHDFVLAPRQTALLTVFNPIRCDLASGGGPRGAAVTDGVLQEIDLRTGLVRREWHSLDHVSLRASFQPPTTATLQYPFDYFHVNSLELEPGGRLLVSGRSTWALYELDRRGGQIVDQIGGRASSFAMGPGTAMAWQHDARLLPGGAIGVFDNGAVPQVHPQSRAIVLQVDRRARSVTLARSLTHPTPLVSASQGDAQWLPDGGAFVGWGSLPYFSEFSAGGDLLFDARLPAGEQSFRGQRAAWTGRPRDRPAVAVLLATGGGRVVYASWNGATEVAAWRLFQGRTPGHLRAVARQASRAFETAIAARGAGPYVVVQALSATGRVLAASPPAHL